MVLPVDPAVWERDRSDDVVLIELLLGLDALTSHVEQDDILLRQTEE